MFTDDMLPTDYLAELPSSRKRHHLAATEIDLRVILCICSALLIIILWGLTLWQLHKTERAEMANMQRDVISLTRLFKAHASRTIEATDQTIIYLRQRYNIEGKSFNIAQELQDGLVPVDIYNLFSIVDSKADVVLSTQPFNPLNLSDRAHIRVHMQSPDVGLYISAPTLGRVSGKWSLQMTRRINNPDGSFKGVVVASMDPSYFTTLYKDVDVGRLGAIAMIGTDGIVRVRHVGADDTLGKDASNTTFFKTMRANDSGTMLATSSSDHRERFFAYEKLDHYPLYVTVGLDIEERLASFHASRTEALIMTSISSLLIVLATVALVILIGNLIESRREAVLAAQAKLHFLSNMSHEFRTPLNGILGYSETLMEDFAGTRHGDFACTIHDSGVRLLGLVDSVLELSALRSGKISLVLGEENLADIVRNAVSRHEEAAQKKGIRLSETIANDVPSRIVCDRTKLLQVLDKLLDNAIRFTDSGSIQLNVIKDTSNYHFSIIDTGCGIPLAFQEKIFEKFAQVDDTSTRTHGGVGLGLTIAALLVKLMDGEIWIRSAPNVGSTFSFSLPLTPLSSVDAPRLVTPRNT
ncbi:signal transduction histidine kinase [Herbaspirillum sp. Sphag1AN]|uniref:cache domain-containing sensor histidine kinase n=1 Tax=unclassified Herbaspirillum TaxID=2624150 RepID=UPI00181A0206|nr:MULTISPECIES: hybrid sensor histidine kinase/response regulator [unclassified Herbaspirillum]MBB3214264.1 signal transduction histidine kinase [Herbaspirillum sp. Sphag1AN]MBB3247316.1 signal transduction histidine kinase [Herbaspirillum sp. Sphag64]